MAGALKQRNISAKSLSVVFAFVSRNKGVDIPTEIVDLFWECLHPKIKVPVSKLRSHKFCHKGHPALQPPTNGRCMIEELPSELRRKLLAYLLPHKDITIRPLCQQHAPKKDLKRDPKHNTVSDLMLLSKKFKDDATTCVYSERYFGIHVHEGIYHGGIEFLDTGRQPLHYKSSITDSRFERFEDGSEFGFNQLKKIIITIHPSTGDGRHNAMTTYYINHALVRMLERSGKDDRIVSLTIEFAQSALGSGKATRTRREISHNEHPWWNHEANQPRSTSIHGISDVELALRPFAMLTTVHDVRIYLPSKVKNHDTTKQFTADLEQSMMSNTALGTLGPNDELDRYAEVMRGEIESFIFQDKYGRKGDGIPDLTEEEYYEDQMAREALDEQRNEGDREADDDDDDDDDDSDNGDLVFLGTRPTRLREIDTNAQQSTNTFTGSGRTLAQIALNAEEGTTPPTWDIRRAIKKDVVVFNPNGTSTRRVAFVDVPMQNTSSSTEGPKHNIISRNVPALEVTTTLDIAESDGENNAASKTLKRDLGDSPGRSRNDADGLFVESSENKARFSNTLDMAARARAREARSAAAAAARPSQWE